MGIELGAACIPNELPIELPRPVKAEWLFNFEPPSLKESEMSEYNLFERFSFLFY